MGIYLKTILTGLVVLGMAQSATGAPPALTRVCKAPALPAPEGNVVSVSTDGALQNAVNSLTSNTTVMIQPGTYNLTSTLWINGGVTNVAIRGSTNSCDDVVLVGRGMSNSNYGGVPHGIWIGDAQRVLVANLTIRDVWFHPIQLNPASGAQDPHFYNLHLIDAGEQFIKSSSDGGIATGVNNGIVEYCTMEYTSTARSDYTNGVDVHTGSDWIIRHNLFRNIRAPGAGELAGPAILMWNGSRNTIVDGNLFLNCQYGIALGLGNSRPDDHTGGTVRNNFFHRSSSQGGDVAITINSSVGTKVLHNTVILSGTYPNAIEYRFPQTTGVDIRYNLMDAGVRSRDGASGTVSSNVSNATSSWFANAQGGDLHLVAAATGAIDQANSHPDVATDYDGESRGGSAPDVGADEYSTGTTIDTVPPAAPQNLTVIE
jgi:hypothetical protein